jgi:hypothetical protein
MLRVGDSGADVEYGAFNLGQLMGLRGLASLIPLFAVWGIAAVVWVRMRRSSSPSESV